MLALVGSGEFLPPMQQVDRQLLDLLDGDIKVICLPTAAGQEGPDRIRYWLDLGKKHFSFLGVEVDALPLIDRAGAHDPRWVDQIRNANLIYFSGGRPDFLVKTLKDTPAWQAVMDVHESGRVVAGCSAGAMMLGERVPSGFRWMPAFGLVPDVVVIPHFEEIPSTITHLIRRLAPRKSTLLGIEGDTALKVAGESWEVLGSGGVTLWNHSGKSRYTQGQPINHNSVRYD